MVIEGSLGKGGPIGIYWLSVCEQDRDERDSEHATDDSEDGECGDAAESALVSGWRSGAEGCRWEIGRVWGEREHIWPQALVSGLAVTGSAVGEAAGALFPFGPW